MIMNSIQEQIKEMICSTIDVEFIEVDGDGRHFQAIVVSDIFEQKSRIERHKIIYSSLGNSFERDLHALSIKAYTREEWKNLK